MKKSMKMWVLAGVVASVFSAGVSAKTFTTLPGILPGRKHVVVYDPVRGRPKAKDGSEAHQYASW